MRYLLLLLVVLCGCVQSNDEGSRRVIKLQGTNSFIYVVEFGGRTYLVTDYGGIVEHKSAKEGE